MKINAKLYKKGTVFKISGTKDWEVDKEFIFKLMFGDSHFKAKIEKGFRTDFGSIPRLFWTLFDKTEYVSYILHDMLYKYHGFYIGKKFIRVTKRQADLFLFYSMMNEGAGCLERSLVLLGLDLGGWVGWKNNCLIK